MPSCGQPADSEVEALRRRGRGLEAARGRGLTRVRGDGGRDVRVEDARRGSDAEARPLVAEGGDVQVEGVPQGELDGLREGQLDLLPRGKGLGLPLPAPDRNDDSGGRVGCEGDPAPERGEGEERGRGRAAREAAPPIVDVQDVLLARCIHANPLRRYGGKVSPGGGLRVVTGEPSARFPGSIRSSGQCSRHAAPARGQRG